MMKAVIERLKITKKDSRYREELVFSASKELRKTG